MITILLCTRKSVVCIKGLFINSWTIYLLKLHVLTIHYLKITSSLIDDDGYDSYFIDHPAPLNCYGFYIFFFTSRWRCRCFSTLTQICWMTRGWTMLMILCCLTHSSHPKTRKSSIQGNRPTCLLMHSVNLFDLLTFWSPLNSEIKRKRLRFLVISVIAVGALFPEISIRRELVFWLKR